MDETVSIYGRKTTECVVEVLSRFNTNASSVTLRAYGGNTQKGIEIAQILNQELNAQILATELDSFDLDGAKIPVLNIKLALDEKSKLYGAFRVNRQDSNFSEAGTRDFINYSTYALLADWYLHRHGKLQIFARDARQVPLVEITPGTSKKVKQIKIHSKIKQGMSNRDDKASIYPKINSALLRAGVLQPVQLKPVAKKLSKHDDVIIGLDTNVLYNCNISEHLIPGISLVQTENYVNRPNWILLVVPSVVMHELENAANARNRNGRLNYNGRRAYRALQEVMELKRNTDIQGITLVIAGQTSPIHDIKEDLKALKVGMNEMVAEKKPIRKSSAGDNDIRQQFKEFIRKLDFHKGIYFLSSDKSNAALAMAESLDPIYLKMPDEKLLEKNWGQVAPFAICDQSGDQKLEFDVPLGAIIYEIAVSFGRIGLSFGKEEKVFSLECDQKGESLHRWVHKQLLIEENDFFQLLENYQGPAHLEVAYQTFKKITERFEGGDWLFEMDSPWKVS